VNQAVSDKASSIGRAFEQFKEAINDEDFEDLLKDAQADPKGVAAQDFLKKVLPFLDIWVGRCRRATLRGIPRSPSSWLRIAGTGQARTLWTWRRATCTTRVL